MTFTRAGTYPYVCVAAPGMQGIVEVLPRHAWPPLDVQLAALHKEETVTFRLSLHNRGSQELAALTVAAPVPENATFVDAWMGSELDNKGSFAGRDVVWHQPDASIAPGGRRGPYVFIVKARAGVDPHDVVSHAWVSFGGAVPGTAISARVRPIGVGTNPRRPCPPEADSVGLTGARQSAAPRTSG